jgi:hypothetical protein
MCIPWNDAPKPMPRLSSGKKGVARAGAKPRAKKVVLKPTNRLAEMPAALPTPASASPVDVSVPRRQQTRVRRKLLGSQRSDGSDRSPGLAADGVDLHISGHQFSEKRADTVEAEEEARTRPVVAAGWRRVPLPGPAAAGVETDGATDHGSTPAAVEAKVFDIGAERSVQRLEREAATAEARLLPRGAGAPSVDSAVDHSSTLREPRSRQIGVTPASERGSAKAGGSQPKSRSKSRPSAARTTPTPRGSARREIARKTAHTPVATPEGGNELPRGASEGSKYSEKGKAARAVEELEQRRAARRAAAKEDKAQRDADVLAYGGRASLHYHRAVKAYRQQLAAGQIVVPDYSPRADSRLSVVVRKRPLLPKELAGRAYDCTTCVGDHAVVVHKQAGGGLHSTFVFDRIFDQTVPSAVVCGCTVCWGGGGGGGQDSRVDSVIQRYVGLIDMWG